MEKARKKIILKSVSIQSAGISCSNNNKAIHSETSHKIILKTY